MKRLFAFLAASLLMIAIVFATAAAFFLPPVLKAQVEDAFAGAGFADVSIGTVSVKSGSIVFSDIRLDPDGFSSLESIVVTFNIQRILSTGKFSRLFLSNMTLTALLNPDGSLEIAGWKVPEFQPFVLPVEAVGFEEIKLDLDTLHGVLRFEAKGEGIVADNGTVDIQGQLWGEQAQMQLRTGWNGSFAPDGAWSLDVQVDEGRFDLGEIRAARLGGWVSAGMETLETPPAFGGQLSAGMLSFGPLSMQNVVAVLEGSAGDYRIVLDAQAAGTKAMTLHAGFGQEQETFFGSAELKTGHASDIPGFLAALGVADDPAKLAALATLPLMTLKATYLTDQSRDPMQHPVALSLRDTSGTIAVSGRLDTDLRKRSLLGSLDIPETSLTGLAGILPIEALSGIRLTGGTVSASGTLFSDLQASPMRLEGPLAIRIRDLSAQADNLVLSGLGVDITLGSVVPPATDGNPVMTFDSLAAGPSLEGGEIAFRLPGERNEIHVDRASAKFAGGRIALDPFVVSAGKPLSNLGVTIDGLDLETLARIANLKDLVVTGKLDGRLDLRNLARAPEIREGHLTNRTPGLIAYNPDEYPSFLAGGDERLKIARETMTHFEYHDLDLTFRGSPAKRMEAKLTAKGRNRPLFGKRPVHLNLNIEGEIPALLPKKTNR
ncbi:MAG: hypothetical protein EOM26_09105 [Alphaproteobacteria bacterium]|nr:hypothetical protein [Alphaproteobacteria bacterium]